MFDAGHKGAASSYASLKYREEGPVFHNTSFPALPFGMVDATNVFIPAPLESLVHDATTCMLEDSDAADVTRMADELHHLAPSHCGVLVSCINETDPLPRKSRSKGSSGATPDMGSSGALVQGSAGSKSSNNTITTEMMTGLNLHENTQALFRRSIDAMGIKPSAACSHDYTNSTATPFGTMEPDWCCKYGMWGSKRTVQIVLAGGEAKNTETSITVAHAQAAMVAATGAVSLHKLGLGVEDCVVPFISFTGTHEQHGAAYVLENGLPCIAQISRCFDLGSHGEARAAAQHRLAIKKRIARTISVIDSISRSQHIDNVATLLDLTGHISYNFDKNYFLKAPHQRWDSSKDNEPFGALLSRKVSARATLAVMEAARRGKVPAVLPLTCIPTIDARDSITVVTGIKFVFENMTGKGFKAGLPSTPPLFYAWLEASVEAVQKLHLAGVVHMDLHPFNILHRINGDNKVEVLLIDFDSAYRTDMCVPRGVIGNLERGAWAMAYPRSLLEAGMPPNPAIDWYYLAGILLTFLHGHGGTYTQPVRSEESPERYFTQLRPLLAKSREDLLKCCSAMREGVVPAVKALFEEKLFDERDAKAKNLLPPTWEESGEEDRAGEDAISDGICGIDLHAS